MGHGSSGVGRNLAMRNREIYTRRLAGATYAALGRQYALSGHRISLIGSREERQISSERRREEAIAAVKKGLRDTERSTRRGCVIDMGGQDGRWHTFTAEDTAREFGLL